MSTQAHSTTRSARAREGSHLLGDRLAHREQLVSVELRDGGLQDLVADGREHTLIVVHSEALQEARKRREGKENEKAARLGACLVYGRELVVVRAGEHSESEVDLLQVCFGRRRSQG
jgi:hypothetical protein